MSHPTFLLHTLGCKINQYESQALSEAWQRQGYRESRPGEQVDWAVVNSCAVTADAVQQVRKAVRKLHRTHPQAAIVVTGCAAQIFPEDMAGLPGVTRTVAQQAKSGLCAGPASADQALREADRFPEFTISSYPRARGVLKVQDGCSHGCTYCIVPHTRGPAVSRPPAESLAEAERLLKSGVRELVLSGINLRQFGRDLDPRLDFWDFLSWLDDHLAQQWAGRARLRLSSLEPSELTAKALATLASCRLVAPHLHLSLQSGSPEVLRRMGRGHYHPNAVREFVHGLRAIWPHFALGADFLLGFPGEDDAAFAATADLVQELPFTYGHVFPYSARPGTPAAAFADQVPEPVKRERCALLRQELAQKRGLFLQQQSRREHVEFIVETHPAQGMSETYIPCREISGGTAALRSLVRARPVGQDDHGLLVAMHEHHLNRSTT